MIIDKLYERDIELYYINNLHEIDSNLNILLCFINFTVIDELKKLNINGFDENDISVASKKKDNISMMFGMPMRGNYGPTISFT